MVCAFIGKGFHKVGEFLLYSVVEPMKIIDNNSPERKLSR